MITEAARVKTSDRQDWGHRDEEQRMAPTCVRDLPRRSVEILRDLGLSKEKIVAYHRRFPTPTPTTGRGRAPWAGRVRERVSKESFDPPLHSSPLSVPVRRKITDIVRPDVSVLRVICWRGSSHVLFSLYSAWPA